MEQTHVKVCDTVKLLASNCWRDFLSAMVKKLEKLKNSSVVLLFTICLIQNTCSSALVGDLFSYNSLFVSQLYQGKSLHTHDLIFFTTDL